jgi:type I restriction enzyme, S subunit
VRSDTPLEEKLSNLPASWAVVDLSEAVDSLSTDGKKVPQKQYLQDGSYPVVDQGRDFIGGYSNDLDKVIECGSPVIVFGDHTKAVKFVSRPFVPGADGVKVLRPRDFILPRLLEAFMRHLVGSLEDRGYARHFHFLVKSSLPIPPLNEQRRIVAKLEELFSELDAGVESLKKALEQLKVYRQALLKHAFEGKLTAKWRTENADKLESADALLERIRTEREERFQQQLGEWKGTVERWEAKGKKGRKPAKPRKPKEPAPLTAEELAELPQLPKGWVWVRLADLAVSLDQGWSPKCDNRPAADDEWAVITTTAVQPMSFLPEENKPLSTALSPRPWLQVEPDDILITRAGPRSRAGVVCRVRTAREKLMICDKVYRLRLPALAVSPPFVEAVLNSPDIAFAVERLKTGINDSGVNLTQSGFLSLCVPIPSTAEQHALTDLIESKIATVDRMAHDIEMAMIKAEALRQSILKQAFSGKLVPQNPNDEPASVLLERIRAEKSATVNGQSNRKKHRA